MGEKKPEGKSAPRRLEEMKQGGHRKAPFQSVVKAKPGQSTNKPGSKKK